MPDSRRDFIKKSFSAGIVATVGSSLLIPFQSAADWPADNFTENKLQVTLDKLFGKQEIVETKKIKLKLPRIAENGAVVPITVSSSLKDVESIFILVEKNPVPLAAHFKLSPELDAFVSARLKMAETCDVIAIVKSADNLYMAKKMVNDNDNEDSMMKK